MDAEDATPLKTASTADADTEYAPTVNAETCHLVIGEPHGQCFPVWSLPSYWPVVCAVVVAVKAQPLGRPRSGVALTATTTALNTIRRRGRNPWVTCPRKIRGA